MNAKTIPLTDAQKTAVAAMLAHIASECKTVDREAAFNEMMDANRKVKHFDCFYSDLFYPFYVVEFKG